MLFRSKKIQSESTKVALAQILENTRNFYKMQGMLNEAGIAHNSVLGGNRVSGKGDSNGFMTGKASVPYATGNMDGYGDYYLPNVVIPMLRRIMPDLIANDLVGVQPLHGPVGYALAYRPVYNNGEQANTEIGYAPTDPRYTGHTLTGDASYEGVDKSLTSYWDAYAGTGADKWYNGVGANTA